VVATSRAFAPATHWAPLEGARERHERALAELRAARRDEALARDRHRQERTKEVSAAAGRILDAEPPIDIGAREEQRKQEADALGLRIRTAYEACNRAVAETLKLVDEHGDSWAEEIATYRENELTKAAELRAQAAAAEARAGTHNHLAKWIDQARTSSIPQPFSAVSS
jgi:hypothetical protein